MDVAEHIVTLTDEEDLALDSIIAQWSRDLPETQWTKALVLSTLLSTDLRSYVRKLDESIAGIVAVARGLTRLQYLPIIAQLTGAQRARLRQLLGERD